ncbi:glycosyltransferase family 4 protein [Occallatibacter savannae]|uniref:glycosyltransferase family 4 protein n=1 Tax=Occallatibacter savannae TaxID=1002691 RepID=UPI000D68907E|nr:glycosyltransferase family 1 protein [Occallatibacter savannae]
MRIALFTETFLPKTDGIVTTLCQTIRQLRQLGHEVLIFSPEGGIREFEGFRVVGMKSSAFPLYPELRLALPRASMRSILSDFMPDILHIADPALLGIAGLYYGGGPHGGALHLPVVVSYHTDLPQYLHYYGLGFLEPHVWKFLRIRHRRAAINLCTSTLMVAQLREHGIDHVALWPGGVDADLFRPERRSAEMRNRLTQGEPDAPLLLYVGRLSAEKNLESLRAWIEGNPGVRLALVGDGPRRTHLEEHFKGLPVHFAGFLHKEELACAYASSDIFVMPSRTETLGLVVLEAMSSGLPVVAARAGGIPEMIQNEVSGLLVDTENEAAMRIGELLQSKPRRTAIGDAARTEASRRTWRCATKQLVDFYEQAIALSQAGRSLMQDSQPMGLRARSRKAMGRATVFALRKLLP